VLIGINPVLRRNRLDGHTLGGIRLNELQHVLRVGRQILTAHGSAQHRFIPLHPSRRAPGRGKIKDIGIHLPHPAQNGQNIGAVMINGEALQLRIGFSLVIATELRGGVGGADTSSVDAEVHFRGMKKIVQELFPLLRTKLIDLKTGSIGKAPAKAEDVLELVPSPGAPSRLQMFRKQAARQFFRPGRSALDRSCTKPRCPIWGEGYWQW
jgi:hypothetical protein